MPNLGSGIPQNLVPGVTPTWVFTPTPGMNTSVRITNNGGNTVWLGGANVSKYNGFPLPPGCRPVELQNCPFTVYAASDLQAGVSRVVNAVALPAGTTSFTLTTTGAVVGPAVIGNAGAFEVVNISAIASSTVITVAPATIQDHVASATVTSATPLATSITVSAGTGWR